MKCLKDRPVGAARMMQLLVGKRAQRVGTRSQTGYCKWKRGCLAQEQRRWQQTAQRVDKGSGQHKTHTNNGRGRDGGSSSKSRSSGPERGRGKDFGSEGDDNGGGAAGEGEGGELLGPSSCRTKTSTLLAVLWFQAIRVATSSV